MSNRQERRARRGNPKPINLPESFSVPTDQLTGHPSGPVTLAEREGVHVHSFKCGSCQLEFMTFSWLPNRHRVGTIVCPECGSRSPMFHQRAIVNEKPQFNPEDAGGTEIYRLWPWPGSRLMDDSVVP